MDPIPKTYNNIPISSILAPFEDQPALVQRISHRKITPVITICDPNPDWPTHFETFKARILAALEAPPPHPLHAPPDTNTPHIKIHSISHIGSTSIPSLPAKPVIDIDLVLSCPSTSTSSSSTPSSPVPFAPLLEASGFQHLLHEPAWHSHHLFVAYPPSPLECNLHVWPGPHCPEVERHIIFRNYLRSEAGSEDRVLYADAKMQSARVSRELGENVMGYNKRKEEAVRGILERAFRWVGVLK